MPDPRTTEADAPTVAPAAPPSPNPPGPSWRRAPALVLRAVESRLFKLGFVLAMAALGGYAVVDQWSDFKTGLDRLGAMAAFEALICVLGAIGLTMQVWRQLLAAAGSRLSLRASSRIFFIGQLGKYLPGSVWPVLTQMELGRLYRVPRQRSATVAMLSMMVGLTSGLLATLIGLPFMAGGKAAEYWWVFLFIPVLLVCLHPRVLNPVIERGLRILHKPAPEHPLTLRVIAQAVFVNLGVWLCFGLQLWVMTARLGEHGADTLLGMVGAFALAWCVGFLFVLAPAGAGVRDLILIAALSPLHGVGPGAATAIALVSRGVTILADLIGAALAALLGRGSGADPAQVSMSESDGQGAAAAG